MLLAKVARRKINENLLFSFYVAQQKKKNIVSKEENVVSNSLLRDVVSERN